MCVAAVAAAARTAAPAAEPNQPTTAPATAMSLTSLLLNRPLVPVTPPQDVPKPSPAGEKFVEGSMVVDRPARLSRQARGGWAVLTFDHVPGRRDISPRLALPCRLLEQME
ncbi:MAG: hypothetical protein J7M21_04030, partial [Planctomycetes bacterium]|nr:hypothetical protein [Planctomycetota bacterium]